MSERHAELRAELKKRGDARSRYLLLRWDRGLVDLEEIEDCLAPPGPSHAARNSSPLKAFQQRLDPIIKEHLTVAQYERLTGDAGRLPGERSQAWEQLAEMLRKVARRAEAKMPKQAKIPDYSTERLLLVGQILERLLKCSLPLPEQRRIRKQLASLLNSSGKSLAPLKSLLEELPDG